MANQVTVGVLTPHAAPGPEVEFPEMGPGRIATQLARIAVAGGEMERPPVSPAELRAAAASDVLAHHLGLPVAATCLSAARALRTLNADRVALVHPPWFDDELNELGAAYFRSQGCTVVSYALADLPNDPVGSSRTPS